MQSSYETSYREFCIATRGVSIYLRSTILFKATMFLIYPLAIPLDVYFASYLCIACVIGCALTEVSQNLVRLL